MVTTYIHGGMMSTAIYRVATGARPTPSLRRAGHDTDSTLIILIIMQFPNVGGQLGRPAAEPPPVRSE
jgi:hypothetical protein